MASRTGFPDVPGYRLDERCDSDDVGAWYRGQATTGDGKPVRVRVVLEVADGGGGGAGSEGAGLARGVLPVVDIVPLPPAGPGLGGAVALVYDDPGGVALGDLLAECGTLTPGQVAGLCGDIAAALRDADGRVVPHGRLSLSTVLIDRDLRVWVSDAGVADAIGSRPDAPSDGVALARLAVLALTGTAARTGERPDAPSGSAPGSAAGAVAGDGLAGALSALALQPPDDLDVAVVAATAAGHASAEDLVLPPRLLHRTGGDLASRLRALAGDERTIDLDGPDRAWRAPAAAVKDAGRRLRARAGRGRDAGSPATRPADGSPRGGPTGHRSAAAQSGANGSTPAAAGRAVRAGSTPSGARAGHSRPAARGRAATGRGTRPAGVGRGSRATAAGVLDVSSRRGRASDRSAGWVDGAGHLLRRPAGRAVIALAAVLLVLAGVRAVTADPGEPVAAPTSKAAPGESVASSPAPGPEATSSGPATPRHTERVAAPPPAIEDPASPATAVRALAQDLADLRGRAWADLDLGAAALLNAPGSAAAKADTAAIRRARADGVRYDGLEFVVRSARARDDAAEGRVVLDVRMDVPAYSIETGGGKPTRRPAATGQRVRLIVHWSGERWQVERVAPA